jgi:hypothetical protein
LTVKIEDVKSRKFFVAQAANSSSQAVFGAQQLLSQRRGHGPHRGFIPRQGVRFEAAQRGGQPAKPKESLLPASRWAR